MASHWRGATASFKRKRPSGDQERAGEGDGHRVGQRQVPKRGVEADEGHQPAEGAQGMTGRLLRAQRPQPTQGPEDYEDQDEGHRAADGQHLEDGVLGGHPLAERIHAGQAGDAQHHVHDARALAAVHAGAILQAARR